MSKSTRIIVLPRIWTEWNNSEGQVVESLMVLPLGFRKKGEYRTALLGESVGFLFVSFSTLWVSTKKVTGRFSQESSANWQNVLSLLRSRNQLEATYTQCRLILSLVCMLYKRQHIYFNMLWEYLESCPDLLAMMMHNLCLSMGFIIFPLPISTGNKISFSEVYSTKSFIICECTNICIYIYFELLMTYSTHPKALHTWTLLNIPDKLN